MFGDKVADPVGGGEQLTAGPFLNQLQILMDGAMGVGVHFNAG